MRHDQVINVTAPALGAMFLEVPLGTRVSQGQCLARILAEPGAGEVSVPAPADGLLIIRAADRMARPGDTIATILTDHAAPGSAAGRTLSN